MFDRSLKLVYQYVMSAAATLISLSMIAASIALVMLVWALLWSPSIATATSVLSAVVPTCLVCPALFVVTWAIMLLCNFIDPQRMNEAAAEMEKTASRIKERFQGEENPC